MLYVALLRTCIYVNFVHLLFNSSLSSIELIQSGYRRISSSSILPRWDFFSTVTQKEKIPQVDCNDFRVCAATSHARQFGGALL